MYRCDTNVTNSENCQLESEVSEIEPLTGTCCCDLPPHLSIEDIVDMLGGLTVKCYLEIYAKTHQIDSMLIGNRHSL